MTTTPSPSDIFVRMEEPVRQHLTAGQIKLLAGHVFARYRGQKLLELNFDYCIQAVWGAFLYPAAITHVRGQLEKWKLIAEDGHFIVFADKDAEKVLAFAGGPAAVSDQNFFPGREPVQSDFPAPPRAGNREEQFEFDAVWIIKAHKGEITLNEPGMHDLFERALHYRPHPYHFEKTIEVLKRWDLLKVHNLLAGRIFELRAPEPAGEDWMGNPFWFAVGKILKAFHPDWKEARLEKPPPPPDPFYTHTAEECVALGIKGPRKYLRNLN